MFNLLYNTDRSTIVCLLTYDKHIGRKFPYPRAETYKSKNYINNIHPSNSYKHELLNNYR